MAITLRSVKGSALTSAEIDANFTTLEANPVFKGAGVTLPNQSVALTGSVLPGIRPSLNLDFANSKQLDPRITFNRGTTGTYYDGKTSAKAEENLLKGSNGFGNAVYWIPVNGTVGTGATALDGTLTAYSFTATAANATLYQTITATALPYTLTLYIQLGTVTGTVNLTLDGTTLVPKTITSTWARYDISNSTLTAVSRTIGLKLSNSGDVVNIWGAQLEQRSTATAYTPTTTAPITNYIPQLMTAPLNVARFDHDPISGKSLGLLIEESRINYILYSQDFSVANWGKANFGIATITPSYKYSIAPDGGLADRFVFNINGSTSTSDYSVLSQNIATTSGVVYTHSIWLKTNDSSTVNVLIRDDSTGSSINTPITVTPRWTRFIFSGANTANQTFLKLWLRGGLGLSNYADISIWGAQLEAGSFATSYIPTTTGSVTRVADQASMTGTNFSSWYNKAQGSLYLDFELLRQAPASVATYLLVSENNIRFAYIGGGSTALVMYDGITVSYANGYQNAIPSGPSIYNKLTASYTDSKNTLITNGYAPFTGGFTTAASATSMSIASAGYNGHIKKLSYYQYLRQNLNRSRMNPANFCGLEDAVVD